MAKKTNYIATDAAGVTHTRSTESRAYTHTVVRKGGYAVAMASALSASWGKTDRSNFDYYLRIAEGRSEFYPSTRYCAKYADRHTPEQIAEEDARLTISDAQKVAEAKAVCAGFTADTYVAEQRRLRVERIETKLAEGGYEVWHNMGWCGRLDLAQKLANASAGGDYVVAVLEAQAV
jgi:hypothetical protein